MSLESDFNLLRSLAELGKGSDHNGIAPDVFASQDRGSEVVLQAVRDLSKHLAHLVAREPSVLLHLEWRDVERMMAEVFEGLGFKVLLTPASKDGGKDIIIECVFCGTPWSYAIEIKHWTAQKVGKQMLTKFVHVVAKEKHSGGLFLATNGFANNAIEMITELQSDRISIGKREEIVSLCQSYVRAESGIWKPVNPLVELIQPEFRSLI